MGEQDDVLADMLSVDAPEPQSDILSSPKTEEKKETPKTSPEKKTEKPELTEKPAEQVPDWLKGNFSEDKVSSIPVENKAAVKTEKPKQEAALPPVKVQETKKPEIKKPEAKTDSFDLEKDTKIESEEKVPDWLKGSFDTPKKDKKDAEPRDNIKVAVKQEKGETKVTEKKTETKADVRAPQASQVEEDKTTKASNDTSSEKKEPVAILEAKTIPAEKEAPAVLSDDNVPDWLKGSFDAPKNEEKVETKTQEVPKQEAPKKSPEKKEALSEEKKTPVVKETETSAAKAKTPETKKTAEVKKTPEVKKIPAKTAKTPTPKQEASTPKTEKKEELWDDGMKIPDWLKADDEK
jgi:hypothetical protein